MTNDHPFGERLAVVESELKKNTALTESNKQQVEELNKSVTDMLELFAPLQGGFKAIQAIGKVAAALTPIAVFAGAVWAILHGKMPTWKG